MIGKFSNGKLGKKAAPYLFLLPFFVCSCVFTLIPILYSFWISFRDFTFLNINNSKFIGFDNYKNVAQDSVFIKSLTNNMKIIIAVVPALIVISLLLAVLLNSKMKFKGFFRSAFYLPYVVSPIAIGVIAVQLFSKGNLIANIFSKLGFENISWHTKMPYAFWLVATVIIWTQIGFYMVLYLNGLQAIPRDYYEAAEIDGASKLKRFRYITLPQLRLTTYLVVFMCLLSVLQIYDQPYVISTTGGATAGSPGDGTLTMVMYIYDEAFRYREMGKASAAAFIVFIIIFAASLVQNLIFKDKEK